MLKTLMTAVVLFFTAQTNVSAKFAQYGIASFYSDYYNGRTMANGEAFYNASNSCAHRTLRFGTELKITNLSNGRTTTCVVRDRGPFVAGRVVDLSKATFDDIAPLSQGLVRVRIETE
jgi:rare lipoprotein A